MEMLDLVEPYSNSLTPDNIGEPPENGLKSRTEVAISYETSIIGRKYLVVKCNVCHQSLDVAYARGGGFTPGMDLILVEPHRCPGKVLSGEKAMEWDLKHRKIHTDPKWKIDEP
jgi:hypothetical protein